MVNKQQIILNPEEYTHCINIHKKMVMALAEEGLNINCNQSFNIMTLALAMTLERFLCQLQITKVDDYLAELNGLIKELHKFEDDDKGLASMYFKNGKEISKEDLN